MEKDYLILKRASATKDVQERIVRNSKLDWVIVRPVILTDGLKTNAYRALVTNGAMAHQTQY